MNWSLIVFSGIITFFTRFAMIALLNKDTLSKKTKIILSYVPSAIFPAIIFPAIFLDNTGSLEVANNSKILASIVAIIVGYLSRNIIATILSGLVFYWILIFFVGY